MVDKLTHLKQLEAESIHIIREVAAEFDNPDMSAAVALSIQPGRYSLVDFPFTMPGGAGGSNSGRSAEGKHKGSLKDDPGTPAGGPRLRARQGQTCPRPGEWLCD